jgi:predicted RNase H-like HicB family nuclease
MRGVATMEKYSIQIIWSDEKKGYVGSVPEIPKLTVIAETAAQAVFALNEAIAAFIEDMQRSHEPVPPPRRLEEYSGQFRLRVPRILHAALVRAAEAEGISLNTYILYLISERNAQQQILKQAETAYGSQLMETMQHVHELVSNITISSAPYSPSFSWQNDSSATITHVQ